MPLPTARQSFAMAAHLARALGANVIPCTVRERRPLVRWAALHSPGSPRLSAETLAAWGRSAAEREERGEPTAWAILPGSARLAVIDCDRPSALAGLIERFGETPLVVRSPTPGRAHLWYRWPDGADVGKVDEAALGGAYSIKARGAMIHAPGSLHRSGTGFYRCDLPPREWVAGLAAALPPLDLAEVERDRVGRLDLSGLGSLPPDWADADEAVRRGIAWLRAAGPPEPGGRESKTWRAAMTLGDLGVPEEIALSLIVAWDAEAPVPRGPGAVIETTQRAYARRKLPGGCRRLPTDVVVDAGAIAADLGGTP